jgi:hypothetical protein
VRAYRPAPFSVLISDIRHSVEEGRLTEVEGDELIANFQGMAVRLMTRRGPKVTNFFYTGD